MEPYPSFSEFDRPTRKQWEEKVAHDLKGQSFEKLIWQTDDGFVMQPIYGEEYNADDRAKKNAVASVQKQTAGWINYSSVDTRNPDVMKIIERALTGGATGLLFIIDNPDVFDFNAVLSAVDLSKIAIAFKLDQPNADFVLRYFKFASDNNFSLDTINGFVQCDVLEGWLSTGVHPDFKALAAQLRVTSSAPNFHGLTLSSHVFIDGGATTVQALAFMLNMLTDCLEELSKQGLHQRDVAKEVFILNALTADYFFEIAKIRALRLLLHNLFELYGIDAFHVPILSSNSQWSFAAIDPTLNILRHTTAAMAAVIGGTDALMISAHTSDENEFSKRIAVNISNLLLGESFLDKCSDPAAGSYYLEALTIELSEHALTLFKEVEQVGGFMKACENNFIQDQIGANRLEKEQAFALRKKIQVGVNQFVDASQDLVVSVNTVNSNADLLTPQHATQAFEALRARTLSFKNIHKHLHIIALLTWGDLATQKTRAGFVRDFFATAGINTVHEFQLENVDMPFPQSFSAAHMIVFCASDLDYELEGSSMVTLVKDGLPDKMIGIAGWPVVAIDELQKVGVDFFIHTKSNLVETLNAIMDRIEQ